MFEKAGVREKGGFLDRMNRMDRMKGLEILIQDGNFLWYFSRFVAGYVGGNGIKSPARRGDLTHSLISQTNCYL